MRLTLLIGLFLATIDNIIAQGIPPVGQWRDHLPYHQAIAVAENNHIIWCATPYSVFSVNTQENSIERWSRSNGLTETGVAAMGLGRQNGKLVIAYRSGNIDVIYRNDVFNIPDIGRSNLSADTTISRILIDDNRAYLSSAVGIFLIDLDKYEVKETWITGSNGSFRKVYEVAIANGNIYAATEEGLKTAPLNSPFLPDYRTWTLISGTNGLAPGVTQNVQAMNGRVLIRKTDSLFISGSAGYTPFYTSNNRIGNVEVSNGKILVHEFHASQSQIVVLTETGNIEHIIRHPQYTAAPASALVSGNSFWIADGKSGLSRLTGNSFESYAPNSPAALTNGYLQTLNDNLWAVHGGVTELWEPMNRKDGLSHFAGNKWINYSSADFRLFDTVTDIQSVAIDPRDNTVWAGSFGGGLLSIKPGNNFAVLKQNSAVQPTYFQQNSYRIAGLAFDAGNNLWLSNYGAHQPLLVKKADGNWRSFTIPFPLNENAVSEILIDDLGQKWIISPKGNGLLCFNHGQSIDNTGDDQWKWYRAGGGNGNLPSPNVLSIAKDRTGLIWVGTDRGVGIIQCAQNVFTTQGCEAVLPVVQQDNFAGYLFRDERVQAIAIDGANRKWIGTRNGVWLISASGEKTIHRFSRDNSPLPDNDVRAITIDEKTGEIFFATASGISSFRGSATSGSSTNSSILVFPNPVPPGYTGTIAIRGVVSNAIVKITEPDGRLVFQTRALGGQAVWNGKDYNGRKISSGVYLVLISNDERTENIAGKIIFINK